MKAIGSYVLMQEQCINLKAKDLEIKPYLFCAGKISKDFAIDKLKKTWLKGSLTVFSFDYKTFNTIIIFDNERNLIGNNA